MRPNIQPVKRRWQEMTVESWLNLGAALVLVTVLTFAALMALDKVLPESPLGLQSRAEEALGRSSDCRSDC